MDKKNKEEKKHHDSRKKKELKNKSEVSVNVGQENIKEEKEEPKKQKTKTFSSVQKRFFMIGAIILCCFLIYIILSVLFLKDFHFVSLLPKEQTSFAMEFNLKGKDVVSISNKKMVLKFLLGEDRLNQFPREDIEWFINNDYRIGVAKTLGDYIYSVNVSESKMTQIMVPLQKYIVDFNERRNILHLVNEDVQFYITFIDGFILFSKSDTALDSLQSVSDKETILNYEDLISYLPNREYFKPVNLLYINNAVFLDDLLQDLEFNNEFSFTDLMPDYKPNTEFIGDLSVSQEKILLSMTKLDNSRLVPALEKPMDKTQINNSAYICPMDSTMAFSGQNLSLNWIKGQKDLLNNGNSILQILAQSFIKDIYKKTEFDLESDFLLNANNYYCFTVDSEKDFDKYTLVFFKGEKMQIDKLKEKIKTAFLRFAPFSKPKLRNYTLQDGTKASEWVIDLEDDSFVEEKSQYKGAEVSLLKFKRVDYPYPFIVASLGDFVVLGNDLNNVRERIDRLSLPKQESANKIVSETELNIEESLTGDKFMGKIMNDKIKKDLITYLKDFSVFKMEGKENNVIEVELDLKGF